RERQGTGIRARLLRAGVFVAANAEDGLTGIAAENVRGILLDIEGTTTSISFVYDVLFPYARQHVRKFLESHSDDASVLAIIDRLRKQHISDIQQGLDVPEWSRLQESSLRESGGDPEIDAVVCYLNWLMDRDSKAEPLKSLQGMIWNEGYDAGSIKGHVFPDVLAAFERWRSQKK